MTLDDLAARIVAWRDLGYVERWVEALGLGTLLAKARRGVR